MTRRDRTEYAIAVPCGLLCAWAIIHCAGCDLDSTVDTDTFVLKAEQCGCYASLVVTEDGGMCERPGATCPRVCTCVQSTMRLCYAPPRSEPDFTGYVCAADEGDAG